MADAPDVSKPASGSYGEGADLVRLKQQLPQGAIGNPPPPPTVQKMPPISAKPFVQPAAAPGRPPTGAAGPAGLPSVLLHPPQAAAPPAPAPPGSQVSPDQARLFLLQNLAQNPQVSSTTRAWAQEVLTLLQGGQGQVMQGPSPQMAPSGPAPQAAPMPAPAAPVGR